MADFKPLYRKTLEHARALGEIPQWRESRKENIALLFVWFKVMPPIRQPGH